MFAPPIHDIKSVRSLGGYRLHLAFADGTEGDIDVASMIEFRGVFEPLRDLREFERVYVDPEAGTIVWPNGADLDPLVLYAAVTKQSIDSLLASGAAAK